MGMGTRGRETQETLPPPSEQARPTPYNIQWGGGALEASRDLETGQVASRVVPVPGPMVEQGSRADMVEQGAQAAMADLGTRAAMADPGTLWAMVGQKIIGEIAARGRSGGADAQGHSGGCCHGAVIGGCSGSTDS